MPDYKPNYFVRAFAVLALVAALALVVVVVVTSSGGSGSDEDGDRGKPKVSKVGRKAVNKGVWVVQPGDTLGEISVKTGIDETTLLQLNPDLDPQALLEGQRIALR
ncbi:MAG TPA: LysM domain-containing protein [Solirubrobacterales bacterium]|jgi:LysM repeat protein|nr:LysM domain-containing protein [Solirubrobacterales bacterium]